MVWRGSEQSREVSGRVFEVSGGWVAVGDGWRRGPVEDRGRRLDPAEVGELVAKSIADGAEPARVYGA